MAKDPLVRFKRYLSDKGLWDDDKEAAERQKANDIVSEAIKTAENLPKSRLEDVFDIVYEELPPQLKEQKASLGAGEGANTWR
jgi:pyruvate dehydrogenase E1 component alpha subunit